MIDRRIIERVNYMDSFPDLCGAVCSFFGKESEARELSERIHAGKPWGDKLDMTQVVLSPAACYPLYPTLTGTIPAGGRVVTMLNWVFRHEPSREPTRMQSFRVREFVRIGEMDDVVAWRDMWLNRGVDILRSLGLDATPDVASDPFFGRGGRMMAATQKEQKLKYEVLVPVNSVEKPTALCSCQLPPPALRFDLQHPDPERRCSPYCVPGFWTRARSHGAVQAARLRSGALAEHGAPTPVAVIPRPPCPLT